MKRSGSARRRAREIALRILYQAEINGEPISSVIQEVLESPSSSAGDSMSAGESTGTGDGAGEGVASAGAGVDDVASDGSGVDDVSSDGASDGDDPTERHGRRARSRRYAADLTRAVEARRGEIDEIIARTSEHWTLSRMATIDRNVLRIAIAELMSFPDVDAPIVIHEAVSVAGKYGGDDSPGFVNGILDRVARELRPGELKAR